MINPMQIIQMMQSGVNPQQMVNSVMAQNPQMQQMFQGVNLNNPQDIQQMCRNICIQKGLDYDTMVSQYKQNGGKL